MVVSLRTASASDSAAICEIDFSATTKFGSIPELADLAAGEDATPKIEEWLTLGRIYLAEEDGQAAGFIAVHEMDGVLYIAEISTHSDFQGKGIGSELLDAAFQWAIDLATHDGTGIARVSLTTYPDIPWNGPWYCKRGFKEVDAANVGPLHSEKMRYDEEERTLVRPGYRRCCMLWETLVPQKA